MSRESENAIRLADAHLTNADLPTFSEAILALESAVGTLQTLASLNKIPPNTKGIYDAMRVIRRMHKD